MIVNIVLVSDTILKSTVIPQKISTSLKNRYLKKKLLLYFYSLVDCRSKTRQLFSHTNNFGLLQRSIGKRSKTLWLPEVTFLTLSDPY